MSLTLATVLGRVRKRHPAFDGSRVPDPVLASCLTDYQNTLIGKAVLRDKGFLATSTSITVNDTVFTNGSPLPSASLAIIGGTVLYTNDPTNPEELAFTTFERRFDPPEFPAVYLLNNTVFLVGQNADWIEIATLIIKFTPLGSEFAAPTDLFIVPDAAAPALVAYGALEAALRCAGLGEKIDVKPFMIAADAAEASYLSTLRISKRARHSTMREGDY